jgi:hypothetical protein
MAEPIMPSLELTIGLVVGTVGALMLVAFHFAESNAAMRGRKGQPLPGTAPPPVFPSCYPSCDLPQTSAKRKTS